MTVLASLQNFDSSFFSITSKDITKSGLNEDIISFSYTEEISRYNSGILTVYDPDHYYSKVLRFGAALDISFGYLTNDPLENIETFKNNPTQAFGTNKRMGIKAYIQNPKGNAGANGVVTFNCGFYGSEMLNSKQYRVHTGMSKKQLVEQLLLEIGCVVPTVNFASGNELLDKNKQIMQRETNYRLLLRLAREWRVIFRISYTPIGLMSGVFISPQYLDVTALGQVLSGAIGGDSLYLEYREGEKNVLEYSWENHQGKSGSGDNVRIVTGADGKPSFIRYVAKGDTILAYKFNPDKVKARLKGAGSFTKRLDTLKDWLNTKDFEKVKWAFDPVEMKTAPQGLGYSMSAKMIGKPLMSAPLKVYFGKGFPVFFTPKSKKGGINSFYCSKVVHNISQAGYKMDLEIADAYTASGGMLVG